MNFESQQACNTALGLARNGQFDQAIRVVFRAIQSEPNDPEIVLIMGNMLFDGRKDAEARPYYVRAVALAPDRANFRIQYGRYLAEQNEPEAAESEYREALRLEPRNVDGLLWYANLLNGVARYDDAEEMSLRLLELAPDMPSAYQILANSYRERGMVDEALAIYRKAVAIAPQDRAIIQSYLYSLHNSETLTALEVFKEHERLAVNLIQDRSCTPLTNVKDPERKVRVGFIGGEFCTHSVARFLLPLVQNLDQSLFQVYGYSTHALEDKVTLEFKKALAKYSNVFAESDEALVRKIRQDKIDILIDLGIHTANARVWIHDKAPAPLSVNYLGYPDTSGLNLDYRIVDERTDPPGSDAFATEQLWRLPGCFLGYKFTGTVPDVGPLPSLQGQPFTFGSFNSMSKLNDTVLNTWAKLLGAVPGSRLLIKSKAIASPSVRSRILQAMNSCLVDETRILFHEWSETAEAHWQLYNQVDIALDPFPYNGTTTTCEALMMGVPTLCLIGDRHCSRVSFDLQAVVGLDGFATSSIDEYVSIGASWSDRKPLLSEIRMGLRDKLAQSRLGDVKLHAQEFGNALREMWRIYCDEE